MKKRGLLITFEGIDGSGKTTQLKMTAGFLRKQGYRFLILREPGSTPVAEQIRKILLGRENKIGPASELLLYLAARADLAQKVIAPALERGVIVLCDRFYDSTMAYQGYGRGLDIPLIERLNGLAIGKVRPNLTFLVDVDYQTSLKRRKRESDRLESESKAFFDRVRGGFLAIARNEKNRIVVLDGKKPAEDIFAEVEICLRKKLNIR
jgi:dTMP kinase